MIAEQSKAISLLTDEQMRTFIAQGFLILKTDFPAEFHRKLLEALDDVYEHEGNPGNNLLPRIRELQQVFDSPIIRGALTSVLGPGYMMHSHRFGHLNSNPQPGNWHKDSYWGNQRIRNHKPWWAMIMYFPQDTPIEMGPTGVMPGSQYDLTRTFESNDDPRERTASGEAGTFALIHYDIWHRSTSNRTGKQRYMLKFEFMRTAHPAGPSWDCADPDWRPYEAPESEVPRDLLWQSSWNWLTGRDGSLANRAAAADGPDEKAAALLNRLTSPDRMERARAANGLGQCAASDRIVDALAKALREDEFEPVRLGAAYGLAAMGERGATALLDALAGDHNDAAISAAYGLSVCGDAVVGRVARLLEAGNAFTVRLAAFVLGELGGAASQAVPALIARIGHPSEDVRRTVVESLGVIAAAGQEEAIAQSLSGALGDEDHQVRFWAGLSLAKRGASAASAVPRLVEALDDDNRYVRGHAAEALRRIGTPEATEVLLDYLFASRWCPISSARNQWYP